MEDDVYSVLTRLEAREMRRLSGPLESSASNSANFGCGSDRRSSPGTSAGSSEIAVDVVSRGASQLLQREVDLTLRRKRRSMHSLPTT
jgi:hypothetical protein